MTVVVGWCWFGGRLMLLLLVVFWCVFGVVLNVFVGGLLCFCEWVWLRLLNLRWVLL